MNKRSARLIEAVQSRLSRLPEDKVAEVLDFVEFLAARSAVPHIPIEGR